MKADPARDIEAYAELSAALVGPSVDRAALLAAHGLDEARWEALDDAWQARLAAEDDAAVEGMPPLLAAYAEAFARAQRARIQGTVLTFDRFVEVVRALRHGGDAAATLQRLGVTFASYLASQQHWMTRMMEDEALAERFRRLMR